MFDLTKEEKIVILFLLGSLAVGAAINYYKDREGIIIGEIAPIASASAKEKPLFININTATLSELIRIKGIGVKLAGRIIEFRDESGPFFCKEDIMKVKGIGKIKFEAIKDYITTE